MSVKYIFVFKNVDIFRFLTRSIQVCLTSAWKKLQISLPIKTENKKGEKKSMTCQRRLIRLTAISSSQRHPPPPPSPSPPPPPLQPP